MANSGWQNGWRGHVVADEGGDIHGDNIRGGSTEKVTRPCRSFAKCSLQSKVSRLRQAPEQAPRPYGQDGAQNSQPCHAVEFNRMRLPHPPFVNRPRDVCQRDQGKDRTGGDEISFHGWAVQAEGAICSRKLSD